MRTPLADQDRSAVPYTFNASLQDDVRDHYIFESELGNSTNDSDVTRLFSRRLSDASEELLSRTNSAISSQGRTLSDYEEDLLNVEDEKEKFMLDRRAMCFSVFILILLLLCQITNQW